MACIHCNNNRSTFEFHTLEVLTLHVRDLGGEKRVQALGDFQDFSVCSDCAQARYDRSKNIAPEIIKAALPFALIGLAGMVITLFFLQGNGAFRLLGFGMLAGGMLGVFGTAQKLGKHSRELLQLEPAEALRQCAWECLTESAPKKSGINDITYIPVDETTLARKNGDLMILYDLLPEIAVQAYDRIHGIEKEPEV